VTPKPLSNWLYLGVLAVTVAVAGAGLRWAAGPPVVDIADLAADPGADPGAEVVVIGEWVMTSPANRGYAVFLAGPSRGLVVCHFPEVTAATAPELDMRLAGTERVVIRGRRAGALDGMPLLRDCRLLD
jgi:hypothetical protein